jgi:CRISPR-associated protein Csd1
MILQALKEYYDRKATDPHSDIAPEGFEKKEIPFLVVIQADGKFMSLEDTREKVGKRLVGKTFLLPRSQQRSGSRSYETTFLLWDHIGYLFRHPESDEKSPKQHNTWIHVLESLPDELKADEGVAAILRFYQLGGVNAVRADPNWKECTKLQSCNMTFRLAGDKSPVPCRQRVQEYVRASILRTSDSDAREVPCVLGCCLITGEIGAIARTHGRTPINKDTKSLVAFQKDSGYDSYGKEQGYNAPVCKSAEFAYTTALNALLRSDPPQRMLIGDATTIFWAAKPADLETQIVDIFGEPPRDDPDRGVNAVKSLFRSVESGALAMGLEQSRFYVLGLAPNKARISVRFWIVDTVAGMAGKIVQHFEDLRIVHGPWEPDALSLFRLLVSTAVQGKSENIRANLAGDTMRAILGGLPYPKTLLQILVCRIRAEHEVTYARASLIKACINREARFKNPQIKEELTMSLDPNNTNIGYRLGRLFAELESLQIRVHTQNGGKEPNATIRDRFYGAASGVPASVFGTLIRLSKHHLSKLEYPGERTNFEKRIGAIMDGIQDFPSHLRLEDQGRFAIGYYHQRNSPKSS